jgi:hypothetical protein
LQFSSQPRSSWPHRSKPPRCSWTFTRLSFSEDEPAPSFPWAEGIISISARKEKKRKDDRNRHAWAFEDEWKAEKKAKSTSRN